MLLKFVNRGKDIEFLEERYNSRKGELVIIFGRRRVGKTELIKEFIKDKPHFYFLARKSGQKIERKSISPAAAPAIRVAGNKMLL